MAQRRILKIGFLPASPEKEDKTNFEWVNNFNATCDKKQGSKTKVPFNNHDVKLVLDQSPNSTEPEARNALTIKKGDVVDAILFLHK